MLTDRELERILNRIDRKGYKAYKDIQGAYQFQKFTLYIDHVQGDPFASPTKIRVRVDQNLARFPEELFSMKVRRIALQDFITRQVHSAIRRWVKGNRGTGKSGMFSIDVGGQEVLERTSALIQKEWVEIRLYMGLPAAGRTILGQQAKAMLFEELPRVVEHSLFWENLPQEEGQNFVECVENQEFIRARLRDRGLIAFVADGAILPRQSGAVDLPMSTERAVPFRSPESLRVTFELPNPVNRLKGEERKISGMGIPTGVVLIVGGGYHGKSTLLKALERGVYSHIPGDGREYVVTDPTAVKIRAEDGRRVEKVDIHSFISNLPGNSDTRAFSSDDASGSTSQAANIIEALEMGTRLLLLDEDTSATNFMVRDARMQALVNKKNEPITPFVDRVQEIYEKFGVSTILVMGGSGDYLDVANTVIMMKDYLPIEVTAKARTVAAEIPTRRKREVAEPLQNIRERIPLPRSFDPSRGRKEVKIDVKGLDRLIFGRTEIDLRYVEQLVDVSQTRAIGHAIYLAMNQFMNDHTPLKKVLEKLTNLLEEKGLDVLDPFHREGKHPGNFARPRLFEIAAAINRLRTLRIAQREETD